MLSVVEAHKVPPRGQSVVDTVIIPDLPWGGGHNQYHGAGTVCVGQAARSVSLKNTDCADCSGAAAQRRRSAAIDRRFLWNYRSCTCLDPNWREVAVDTGATSSSHAFLRIRTSVGCACRTGMRPLGHVAARIWNVSARAAAKVVLARTES